MESRIFPKKYLLLPLYQLREIIKKDYPFLDEGEIMKIRRKEKNKFYSKERRQRKKDNMKRLIIIVKKQEEKIKSLKLENKLLNDIINNDNIDINIDNIDK